jgi:hypothetical protein
VRIGGVMRLSDQGAIQRVVEDMFDEQGSLYLREEAATFPERLRGLLADLGELADGAWNFELLMVED